MNQKEFIELRSQGFTHSEIVEMIDNEKAEQAFEACNCEVI